jgi:hypothetical protein
MRSAIYIALGALFGGILSAILDAAGIVEHSFLAQFGLSAFIVIYFEILEIKERE